MVQLLSDDALALPGVGTTRAKKTPWHSFGGVPVAVTGRGKLPARVSRWAAGPPAPVAGRRDDCPPERCSRRKAAKGTSVLGCEGLACADDGGCGC